MLTVDNKSGPAGRFTPFQVIRFEMCANVDLNINSCFPSFMLALIFTTVNSALFISANMFDINCAITNEYCLLFSHKERMRI